jgi:integrase
MTMADTPLQRALLAQLRVLQTTHQPNTVNQYRWVSRHFLTYLQQHFPPLTQPRQLRRDPHLLGWLEALWTYRTRQGQPLHPNTRGQRVLALRVLLEMMRDSLPQPLASPLLLRSDVPKPRFPLPRPLHAEDDLRLRQYWEQATGLLDTALALMRLTGIRISECVGLTPDCLRHAGDQQWSLPGRRASRSANVGCHWTRRRERSWNGWPSCARWRPARPATSCCLALHAAVPRS